MSQPGNNQQGSGTAVGSFLLAAMLALFPMASYAYVGPGAGLGMIGSLVAVVVAVLVAVAGLIILPVRLMMKRRSKHENQEQGAQADSSQKED